MQCCTAAQKKCFKDDLSSPKDLRTMSVLLQAEDGSGDDYDDFWADYADYSEEEEQTNLVSLLS